MRVMLERGTTGRTSCPQTKAAPGGTNDPNDAPPMPAFASGAGWEGYCTFPAATPTPPPPPVATPVVTPTVKPAPKISVASFKRSKRTLTVSGTTTATDKLTVKLAYKVGKKSRTKTFSVTVKGGKFSGTLKLSAGDAKKASKLAVTVSATGTQPARKTVSVKR